MLIKALFTDSKNYEKSLRYRRLWAVGMLIVGLVGFACYFLLVPDSNLPDYAQGFYLGAASGITTGALFLMVRTQYLITHPQAQRKAKIKETDEREMQIGRSAAQIAGGLTVFAAAIASFIVLPLSREACFALTSVIAFYILCALLSSLWLSKKL